MPFKFGQPIAELTVDEFQFATAAAEAAYTRRMPTQSMATRTSPIEFNGQTYRLSEQPINHAAAAIMDSLKHDPKKAEAALARVMMIGFDVFNDPRMDQWTKDAEDGDGKEVHLALIEAIATMPFKFGEKPNIDDVFALAVKIRERSEAEAK